VIGDEKKREIVLLILFFALAILVRAPGLGRWCFAVDEFYFSKAVSFILEKGLPMFPGGGYYIRGIGLQYLTALPVSFIGNLELAVRIIPLLFGCMTIPLFFLFCRKFMEEGESILCTIILLLSSWHIELSRFARMYMPFQFFFFLFLYNVHSGFRGNVPRHRIAAWIVAAVTVFVYEGSVIPALLLAALVLTGDSGKTNKSLALFSVLFLALLSLNLAANLVNYRSLGVPKAELVTTAPPVPDPFIAPVATSSAPYNSRVILPDFGLLAFACRSWSGRALLAILVCAGAWLAARSIRKYEGQYSKGVLYLSIAPLVVLPLVHQFGILVILGVLLAMNRRDIRLTVEKDLPYWGIYVFLAVVFWGFIAVQSGNLNRSRHFLVGYPPMKYAVLEPFLHAIPNWMVFLLGMAAFSILRNVLFRKWEEDVFPITILILCLALIPVFKTLYKETRYSFFFFPLFLLVAMGEMRVLRRYLSEKVWPAFGKKAGSLLLTIPLAVFLSTEDFHVLHVFDVSAPALNFRTGPYSQFADHWYPRFDFKTPVRFVEGEYVEGDVIVLEQVAISQYLGKPFLNYVPEDSERFRGIARKGGTQELWSGRQLISDHRQLASKVPVNGLNSLWIIGIVWDFHGGPQNLDTMYQEFGQEFGLGVELAFVGIDGRTGVWRMRRQIVGEAANPVTHHHEAKERNNS
jgi:Dolichyl-phosphate-mannose-protein mannosyltransferase